MFAFEPDARNLRHLEQNRRNADNITVVPVAVTEQEVESVAFCLADEPSVNVIAGELPAQGNRVVVPATTIDRFCREHSEVVPCAVKVDVEGYDLPVVRGAREVIGRFEPLFLIEFYEGPLNTPEALFDFCAEVGYSVFAHVKPRRADGSYDFRRIVLRELTRENWGRNWRIMIFLVPGRWRSAFEGLVH